MGNYILAEWTHLTTAYPERIMAHSNKPCIQLYGERNELKAGFGLWCGVTLHRLKERMEFPWVPGLLHALILFFDKPKNVKCWKKWWKYCWLELKELAMIHTGRWFYVYDDWLWVLRTFDGKLMVFRDEDDIPKEINKESMTRYQWDEDENAYVKYVPPPPKSYTEMLREMMSVVPYLTGC